MSHTSIQLGVLQQVVAGLGQRFATKDVSEDQRMVEAHRDLASHSHYHSFVGRALSEAHVALGIDEVRKGTSRGSQWEKKGLIEPVRHSAAGSTAANGATDADGPEIGPQYAGDSPFTAQMRRHQSWYRAKILGVPHGTGPTPQAKTYYGNMLRADAADRGCNFLTPEIAQLARERIARGGGAIEPFRLFRNMLSSQPMCFNLFGPLANDQVLARQLVSLIVPEKVQAVVRVSLEWAPEPAANYLGDRTAFDAFIEYRDVGGRLCALGVETKLTESFSAREYDGELYRKWMRVVNAPWRADAVDVHQIQHNQLWRDHLLAVALRHQPDSPYAITRLMLVRHPLDRDCEQVVAAYRKLLRDADDSFIDMPLDRLIESWRASVTNASHVSWLNQFCLRYLELEKSQNA